MTEKRRATPDEIELRGMGVAYLFMILGGVGLYLLLSAIGMGISDVVMSTIFIGGCIYVPVTYWRGKRLKGDVEIDCGPNAYRWMFFGFAVLCIVLLIVELFMGIPFWMKYGIKDPSSMMYDIPFMAFNCLLYIFMSRNRLQICSRGIWSRMSLLPWHRIKSYRWSGNQLIIEKNTKFRFLREGVITFPWQQQEAVDAILRARVPPEAEA